MARLIELTDRASGNSVLVNVDLVARWIPCQYIPGVFVFFSAEEDITVSETLDEIAEKVKSLDVPVLRKGE